MIDHDCWLGNEANGSVVSTWFTAFIYGKPAEGYSCLAKMGPNSFLDYWLG